MGKFHQTFDARCFYFDYYQILSAPSQPYFFVASSSFLGALPTSRSIFRSFPLLRILALQIQGGRLPLKDPTDLAQSLQSPSCQNETSSLQVTCQPVQDINPNRPLTKA